MKFFWYALIFLVGLSCSGKDDSASQDDACKMIENAVLESDTTYLLTEYGILVAVPEGWIMEKIENSTYSLMMSCDTGVVFCPNIAFRLVQGKEMPIDEYAKLFVYTLQQRFDTFKGGAISYNKYGEFETSLVDFTLKKNGAKLRGTTALFNKSNYVVNISLMAIDEDSSYEKYKGILENILKSLKRV